MCDLAHKVPVHAHPLTYRIASFRQQLWGSKSKSCATVDQLVGRKQRHNNHHTITSTTHHTTVLLLSLVTGSLTGNKQAEEDNERERGNKHVQVSWQGQGGVVAVRLYLPSSPPDTPKNRDSLVAVFYTSDGDKKNWSSS